MAKVRGTWLAIAILAADFACADDPALGAGWPSATEDGRTNQPPEVIDIGQDVLVLRESESIIITAVVVDSDDDVVSGELYGPGEPALYGALSPHGSDRWRIEVGWDEVNQREPLQFELEIELPFTLRFVDALGYETAADLTLRAICGGIRDNACGGECVDIQTSELHCDGCGKPCATSNLEGFGSTGGCQGGTCLPRFTACFELEPAITCDLQCGALGAQCVPAGCEGQTVMTYDEPGICGDEIAGTTLDTPCEADLESQLPSVTTARCCCG